MSSKKNIFSFIFIMALLCISFLSYANNNWLNDRIILQLISTTSDRPDGYQDITWIMLDDTSGQPSNCPNPEVYYPNSEKLLHSLLLTAYTANKSVNVLVDDTLPKQGGACRVISAGFN